MDQVKKTYAITPDSKTFKIAEGLIREFENKHPICATCPIQKRCNWPAGSYLDVFDDSEIVKARQDLDLILEWNKGGGELSEKR